MKISIVNRTTELPLEYAAEPEIIRESILELAGKAAGICYMPDDYLSTGIQDKDKAIMRAKRNAINGHYSVFEHYHISFIIETSKAMAMILNSLRLYNTSEKSARYTIMKPETEIEQNMYDKWTDIFNELIKVFYGAKKNETEIDKLARENARYMISVFTPTVMEYTIPSNRAILMCGWLDDLSERLNLIHAHTKNNSITSNWDNFYSIISDQCSEMAGLFRNALGITIDDPILRDHKDIGIEFFRTVNFVNKYLRINSFESLLDETSKFGDRRLDDMADDIKESYGDNFTSRFKASFACVAQDQRHRTTSVSVNLPAKPNCYVPKMIKGSMYEDEWRKDFKELVDAGVVPQGTLLDVVKRGRFEDFVLECKERLCNRAQLEIMEVTREQVVNFAMRNSSLCSFNDILLNNMVKIHHADDDGRFIDRVEILPRCQFKGYTCNEPCGLGTTRINYYRNI